MQTRAGTRRRWFLPLGAAALLLTWMCPAVASEMTLAIWHVDGGNMRYSLSEIERVTLGDDTLYVEAGHGFDKYAMDTIARIEFLWDEPTGIDDAHDDTQVLKMLHLFQNQPNPFSPETTIAFNMPREGPADLRIYAPNGRLVRTLTREHREAGRHTVRWDGRDDSGRRAASGVYFYVLEAPGVEEHRRMVLLR